MELFEAVERRYSYRGAFKDTPVPREDLQKILHAGTDAPTGCNLQTCRFVAVTDPALRAQMAEVMPMAWVKTAPAIIVVLSQKIAGAGGRTFEFADYAAATQNMLLAITALGYATVWIDGQLYDEGRAQKVSQIVKAPEGCTPRVVLPVGVPVAEGPRKEKMAFEERAFFDTF